MKLAPHSHTGRRLARQHSSFTALAFLMVLTGVLLLGYGATARSSSQVDVSASIPAPPPSGPPRITAPADGVTTKSAVVSVKGTCDPGLVVRVYLADRPAAAGVCTSAGGFVINVTLGTGQSTLSARQFNADGVGSGRSNIVRVTYQPAGISPPPGVPAGSPGLIVTAPATVIGGAAGSQLSFGIRIIQGSGPFAVAWVWGDGTQSLVSRQSGGDITQGHLYSKPGNYQVEVVVKDAAGNEAQISLVGVANGPAPVASQNRYIDGGILLIAWPIYLFGGSLLLSFWLGERFEDRRHPEPAKRRQLPPAKPRPGLKLAIWLGLVGLGAFGSWRLMTDASQPVHTGAIAQAAPLVSPERLVRFTGDWLAYDVPVGYSFRANEGDATLPESDIFVNGRLQLAVTLRHVSAGQDSTLALRRSQPASYREEALAGGIILVTGSDEVAAFVPLKGETVEVVASGGLPSETRPVVMAAVNHLSLR